MLPNWALAQDCVILLHGLARSEASFALMARSLRGQGYHVVNPEFSTRGKPIEALVSETLPEAVAGCDARRLHFVTHSLGGIVVRAYLAWAKPENLGHVVMLGPPNKGSEVVDAMQALAAFDWVNGPAGRQLSTEASSFPNRLPRVNFSTPWTTSSLTDHTAHLIRTISRMTSRRMVRLLCPCPVHHQPSFCMA